MDLALVQRLTSGEGWGLLQALPAYDPGGALVLGRSLREAGFDADLVSAALTQARLRARAVPKFGDFAKAMLFTPDGLEQATRLEVAARHASRFRAAGMRQVWDLGCGIGGDAMAIAGLDIPLVGVEADEATAGIAGFNLRHWPSARVEAGPVERTVLPAGAGRAGVGVWLDPARRTPGRTDASGHTRRVFGLDGISPRWELVQHLARSVPGAGAKLSPALAHRAVPAGCEAQWTSYQGEVLECVLWWGELVRTPGRTALVLSSGGRGVSVRQTGDELSGPPAGIDALAEWLYEPDRAVIRAGLTGTLAAETGGVELDGGVGYVSSGQMVDVPYAHRYRVLDAMPYNIKSLRSYLRDRGLGALTIKKRGVAIDPDQLRRQLRPSGTGAGTIVLTRVAGRPVVLVVRPA